LSRITANITATVDDMTLMSAFFICTFNASTVTFIHFLSEWRIACSLYRKTVWM